MSQPRPDDVDTDVLEEITLTAEVMIAANTASGRLPREEVDRLLGLGEGDKEPG